MRQGHSRSANRDSAVANLGRDAVPTCMDGTLESTSMDSRICVVVGPNEAGKSTLLKLLTSGRGEPHDRRKSAEKPTATVITLCMYRRIAEHAFSHEFLAPCYTMGIYNQHFVDPLPMNVTPVEHLRNRFQYKDYQSICKCLGYKSLCHGGQILF
jgi:ATPase subunit of ABC transporter with duplicated ATPase domains